MADTTELYTGAINEFVDWITGINKITGEHVDTELRQISGKSIRELLQNRLLKPVYVYDTTKSKNQIVFPSKAVADLWEEAGPDNANNKYDIYKLITLPKPSSYKFQFKALLQPSGSSAYPVENLGAYYVLKSGSSVDLDVLCSYRTVGADDDALLPDDSYQFTYQIQDPNGITKGFTRKREMGTTTSNYTSDAVGQYLKPGENIIKISMTGIKSNITQSVITISVNIVTMDLSILFDDSPQESKINLNRAIQQGDTNINSEDPQLMVSYNLTKTIIGKDNKVHFDIFVDADVPADKSALFLNDESYHINDGTAEGSQLVSKDGVLPTFEVAVGNTATTFTIDKNTQGVGDVLKFFTNLKSVKYCGQHSMQMYAYIIIDQDGQEKKFMSNTVYFTFNLAATENNNLYANIYYANNKYSEPYFTNASNRHILCNQYQDVNISWSIYSLNPNNREIEWDLEYDNPGYNTKITTQTVAPYSSGNTGTLLEGNKGLQFIPIYTDEAWLKAYSLEKVSDTTVRKKLVTKIKVITNRASFQIQERGGYDLKLSAYSKANNTQDQEEWIPKNSGGGVPKISTQSPDSAYTEFHNINFNSDSTGWVNHGLNIYGQNSYAIINYNALEMPSLTTQGHTIEIEFETMRVLSDNDVLLKIGNNSGGSIIITPTKAYVASNGSATPALTNYKINERMRLAFIFNKYDTTQSGFNASAPDNNLIYIVNNGILERAALMSGSANNYRSTQGIILIGQKQGEGRGSGIIVYNIKVYNAALTYNEALHNYILDATNKAEIINRNRSLDMATQTLKYEECCSYVPTFLITGDLTRILNKNKDGVKYGKEDSESNVDIVYTNPFDPTRNFSVTNCQIRKHGQSTLTYPITSMKFWLNKVHNNKELKPELSWPWMDEQLSGDRLTKNRYVMKQNSFVDDNNLFADLAGKPSIPGNKFVLQANYADSSGVHNGAIERLIELTWMRAQVNNVYVLRTPPQMFTTNVINKHDYEHKVIDHYDLIEQEDGTVVSLPVYGDPVKIEAYTLDEAYGPNSYWKIFTGPPQGIDVGTWNAVYARIKNLKMYELINIVYDDYSKLTEQQLDTIDAELLYQGYGKLHSSHKRYNEFNNQPGHVAGHIQWNEFFPAVENQPRPFPYHIGNAADSLPCAVFYQSTTSGEEATKQFLGQYVFMEDKKSEECFGEASIYAGKGGNDNNDPFCFMARSSKEQNGAKQNAKQFRLWNNKRVLRIEVLNIDTVFTSFLAETELDIPITHEANDEKSPCRFDDIVRTAKDQQGNYTGHMCWETDFELIYPDPDDIAEDQAEENEDRIKEGKNPINNYYEEGSEFRKTTLPWVDFFYWVVSTVGDQLAFQEQAAMHMDLWKMAAYYIFYLRFGLVDSVERNAQWKTYDGIHWHCEPWDMDIALGNNNQGQITYEPPMTRKTKLGLETYAFSGSGLTYGNLQGNWIWNALEAWTDWKDDIVPLVADALSNAGLTYDNINYMFDQEYVYKWSESIYNMGGHFKYIESDTERSKLTWLQGSRETHRHWWLYESMNYYDSLWKCGDYINKSVQIFTVKDQGAVGYADITTNRDCLIMIAQNYVGVGLVQAKANTATGSAVSFTNLSLSTKVPLDLYGSMFFEKLDISTISGGLARLDLSGATSAISGGTLYELNIGTKSSRISAKRYTFNSFGSNKLAPEGGHFEHLLTYNIEGQTMITFEGAGLSNMPALENLYAKASGIDKATFSELSFNNLELPASTQRLNGTTSVLTNISFTNVSWNKITFWTSVLQLNNTQLSSTLFEEYVTIGDDSITCTVPSTISSISFSGSTASTPASKDFIYQWLWVKYNNVISAGYSTNNEEQLRAAFASCNVSLLNIDWEISTGFGEEYDAENPDKILLLSYLDLKLLAYIPQQSRTLTGYIVIGDSSDTIGVHRHGNDNKLTSSQMEQLQSWYGDTIFSNNAVLQISHIKSYISLSIVTNPANNGSSYKVGNHVYLKESELGAGAQIIVNATRFGVRNDNTVFDWKVLYYPTEGDENMQPSGTNPEMVGNKSIKITYDNDYRNQLFIYARESNIMTMPDANGNTIEAYPIVLRAAKHGDDSGEFTEIDFTVLPKIWPSKIRINATAQGGSNYMKMYPGMNILGIRGEVTITIDSQGLFENYPNEWYSVVADGDTHVGEGNQLYQKYKFDELSTLGTSTTQGVITFFLIKYQISDMSTLTMVLLDNAEKGSVASSRLIEFQNNTNKPKLSYYINNQGQLVLLVSELKDEAYDYNIVSYFVYGNDGNPIVNTLSPTLNTTDLTIRILNDKFVILTSAGNNTYQCIADALVEPLQATPSTELYKMDLYLLQKQLNFSIGKYKRSLNTTLSNLNDSIFLYLPNIKEINLAGCNVPMRQMIFGIYRNSFDFSNCSKLQILNMSQMLSLNNEATVDLRNCTRLTKVLSSESNITFLYPENSGYLNEISFGNPVSIVLKSLPGLVTITEPTDNLCEHIDFEELKNGSTFTYFAKVYKKLRK